VAPAGKPFKGSNEAKLKDQTIKSTNRQIDNPDNQTMYWPCIGMAAENIASETTNPALCPAGFTV
jgi:hypothetical protein